MTRPLFHVWYSYKSGLGIEIARLSPLLRRLTTTHQVMLASFNAHLYEPQQVSTYMLEEHLEPIIDPLPTGPGVCFFAPPRHRGPYQCKSLLEAAQALSWPLIDEELGAPGCNVYQAAEELAAKLCPDVRPSAQGLLQRGEAHGAVILNLFGGASAEKGLTSPEHISELVRSLARLDPERSYIVPVMPHQTLGALVAELALPNVTAASFEPGDPRLTQLMTGAKAVATIEGGPLHVAVDAGRPTFLMSSQEWLDGVQLVLPPARRYERCVLDLRAPDVDYVTRSLLAWLDQVDPVEPGLNQ